MKWWHLASGIALVLLVLAVLLDSRIDGHTWRYPGLRFEGQERNGGGGFFSLYLEDPGEAPELRVRFRDGDWVAARTLGTDQLRAWGWTNAGRPAYWRPPEGTHTRVWLDDEAVVRFDSSKSGVLNFRLADGRTFPLPATREELLARLGEPLEKRTQRQN